MKETPTETAKETPKEVLKETSKEASKESLSTKSVQQSSVPVKVLSYSDAIKLREKPSNKQDDQTEQTKKENDAPNKQCPNTQVVNENQKENDISVSRPPRDNHKENRSDHKKEHKKSSSPSNKEFHGFKSAKSHRNRSDKK